jgi:hypothetical protein
MKTRRYRPNPPFGECKKAEKQKGVPPPQPTHIKQKVKQTLFIPILAGVIITVLLLSLIL